MNELKICDDDAVLDAGVYETCPGQWVVCYKDLHLGPGWWSPGYIYTYPTQNAAEQALAEWKVKHICWITPQQAEQYSRESFEAAKHCSLIHWQQIQAAGWRGYKIAEGKNLVHIWSGFCAFCQRYPDYKNCPLKIECKGRCCHEYYDASRAEETGFGWDEAVAAIIVKIEAVENPEPPKPLITLPVNTMYAGCIYDADGRFVCGQVEKNIGQALCDLINGEGRK